MFFILPCTDEYRSVDMRSIVYDVPPQEILTKDSVTASVDAVVYYRVVNPIMSIICVYDAYKATQLLAQTFLRNVLGTKNLSQLLSDRENISKTLQMNLDEATGPWGVKVERVEMYVLKQRTG
ncbi:unnamed protein product [Lymnaea stagnalis]|uniref:Band 7 domain-containing protein n=1 Tax=Lymnaea stagnalis TaxID=6523 RepID=A0AAV2I348_LYMST